MLKYDFPTRMLFDGLVGMYQHPEEERQHYLYVWCYKEDGEEIPFYVGRGIGGRWKETQRRSRAVYDVLRVKECYPVKVFTGLTEWAAIVLEQVVKDSLKNAGFVLCDGEHDEEQRKTAQRRGIEIAKREGKYKGRKPVEVDKYKFAQLYEEVQRGERSNKYVMDTLGLKRNTYYKLVEEYKTKTGRFAE